MFGKGVKGFNPCSVHKMGFVSFKWALMRCVRGFLESWPKVKEQLDKLMEKEGETDEEVSK